MWVIVYFFYPETANIPMEEMGRLFGDEVAGTLEDELRHHGHGEPVEKTARTTELEVCPIVRFDDMVTDDLQGSK